MEDLVSCPSNEYMKQINSAFIMYIFDSAAAAVISQHLAINLAPPPPKTAGGKPGFQTLTPLVIMNYCQNILIRWITCWLDVSEFRMWDLKLDQKLISNTRQKSTMIKSKWLVWWQQHRGPLCCVSLTGFLPVDRPCLSTVSFCFQFFHTKPTLYQWRKCVFLL